MLIPRYLIIIRIVSIRVHDPEASAQGGYENDSESDDDEDAIFVDGPAYIVARCGVLTMSVGG